MTARSRIYGLADILPAIARFAEDVLVPLGRTADKDGCVFSDGRVTLPPGFAEAFRQFAADGWIGLSLPTEFGGMGLSNVAQAAVSEIVNGACLPLGMIALTARAGALTLLKHAEPELRDAVAAKLSSGEWTATIAMTERTAGSDASLMRTTAFPIDGRRYRINGNKQFISFADHDLSPQNVHLVLAKTAEADGAFSLFAVPKIAMSGDRRNDPQVEILGIESKLGLHGSPTCAISFRDTEGILIGKVGEGLRAIFTMVNTMRLEVAVEGVGISQAATDAASLYAGERVQGRGPDGTHLPIIRHPDVRRMLLSMMSQTQGARALTLQTAAYMDESDRDGRDLRAAALLGLLLPI